MVKKHKFCSIKIFYPAEVTCGTIWYIVYKCINT